MEHYKILGIDEKSSMEEVKRAYENKINEYKEIIKDEKRLKSFIKEFDKAYEEIKKEKQESKNIDIYDIYYDNEEYINRKSRRQALKKSSTIKRGSSNKRQLKDNKKEVNKRIKSSSKGSIVKLPLKILALPVIFVLSIVIFLCKIINVISWIASKVIIIASISASAIHGYQIYIGHAVKYEIFIVSAIAFVASIFLPRILNIALKILEAVNGSLKRVVF